jgi:integrase
MTYRKRVPKQLQPYLNRREITKVIKSDIEAIKIDTKLVNALSILNGTYSDEVKQKLIQSELSEYVKKKQEVKEIRYEDAVLYYLEHSKVSASEMVSRKYFFEKLLRGLMKEVVGVNPIIADITPKQLNEIAKIIAMLPSRNYGDYKQRNIEDIISEVVKGIKVEHTLNVDTVNKHIKRIRSLALFGSRTGLFSMTSAVSTVKHHYNAREQRKALSTDEIEVLLANAQSEEVVNFIQLVRYTGLRTGEIIKYELKTIDGVECLDLTNASSLKTMSSFRVIPKHAQLKLMKFTLTVEHLSRVVKGLIDTHLEDTEKKTLYSLRHSFASELIQRGVRVEVVSELLGHAHKGMTLSRYAKGFSVEQLYDAVSRL